MTPDPDCTLILAFEYQRSVSPQMRSWLGERFPNSPVLPIRSSPYIPARNSAMRHILNAGPEWEWVVSVDNDVTPDLRTDDWLNTMGDLVACRCPMPHAPGDPWEHEDSFHNPLWFGRIPLLKKVALPWFMFDYGNDGCGIVACDCEHLRQKATAAGLKVRNGGWCNHASERSWV